VPVFYPDVTHILGQQVYRKVADVPGVQHHRITKSNHSINATGPAPPRVCSTDREQHETHTCVEHEYCSVCSHCIKQSPAAPSCSVPELLVQPGKQATAWQVCSYLQLA
jgi:hypothetical protein